MNTESAQQQTLQTSKPASSTKQPSAGSPNSTASHFGSGSPAIHAHHHAHGCGCPVITNPDGTVAGGFYGK